MRSRARPEAGVEAARGRSPVGLPARARLYVSLFSAASVVKWIDRQFDGNAHGLPGTGGDDCCARWPDPGGRKERDGQPRRHLLPGAMGYGVAVVGGRVWTAEYRCGAHCRQADDHRVPLPFPGLSVLAGAGRGRQSADRRGRR
jgi:hypothetical protein